MKKYLLVCLLLLSLCGCQSETVESCYAEEPAPRATAEQLAAMEQEVPQQAPSDEPAEEPADEPAEEPQTVPLQEEPTGLTVLCGENTISVMAGTYSWKYDNGDGTQTAIEACGIHPLDEGVHLPVLSVDAAEAALKFENPAPDQIVLHSWSVDQQGDYDAKAETIPLEDGVFVIEANRIYEVTAEWSDFFSWGGTAYYVFSTETE